MFDKLFIQQFEHETISILNDNDQRRFFLKDIDDSKFNVDLLKKAYEIAKFCHPYEAKKMVKVFIRSLAHPLISFEWYKFIANSNLLCALVVRKKQLAEKPHRHQLRLDHPMRQRLEFLIGHYMALEKLFDERFLKEVLLTDGAIITNIITPLGDVFDLKLKFGGNESKEGELAIVLSKGCEPYLAKIRFSLLSNHGQLIVFIGGLQGAQGENRRERVNDACKLLSGLSPSRIVLEGCLAFASKINAYKVLAVANKYQISKSKPNHFFDYDEYWTSVQGVRTESSDYELPLFIDRKLKEDTPRKRRAKYRRQHEYLDFIHSSVQDAIRLKI